MILALSMQRLDDDSEFAQDMRCFCELPPGMIGVIPVFDTVANARKQTKTAQLIDVEFNTSRPQLRLIKG